MAKFEHRKLLWAKVREIIKAHKLLFSYTLLAPQLVSFLEIAFISCILFLIDTNFKATVLNKLTEFGLMDTAQLNETTMITYIFIMGTCLLSINVFIRYSKEITMHHMQFNLYTRNCQQLVQTYLYADMTTARKIGKGKIVDCIMNDFWGFAIAFKCGSEMLGVSAAMIIYLLSALLLSWKILIIVVVVFTGPMIINRKAYRKMQTVSMRKLETQELMLGYFSDIMDGFERSKLDGLEDSLALRSTKIIDMANDWHLDKTRVRTRFALSIDGLTFFGLLVVIIVGMHFLGIPLPTLLALFVIFNRFKSSANNVANDYLRVKEFTPHIKRFLDLLTRLEKAGVISQRPSQEPHPERITSIEIKNVSFKYSPKEEEDVLKNISLVANSGDRILIKGPSGHGKSTLVEVLCGLLPVTTGSVTYNNIPLDNDFFYKVRQQIFYAAPTVHLFEGTLRENLTINQNFTEEEIHKALEFAELDAMVRENQFGMDTNIGSNGDKLSLGQRQRLILTRLYLRQPSVVILDEATSNLDRELEAKVIDKILRYIDQKAILITVAHREPKNIEYTKKYNLEHGRLIYV